MMSTLLALLPKVLLSIGMRLLSEEMLENLLLWALEKLSQSTKTKVDDEIFAMIKKALEDKHEAK